MAGTGHGYEVVNIADVRSRIGVAVNLCMSRGLNEAAEWFEGKSFLRYLTSSDFVFKVRLNASRTFLDSADEAERLFIASKFNAGGDVRLFSDDQFRLIGPDIPHVIDWMDEMVRTNTRSFSKIRNMTVQDLLRKVARWVPARSESAEGEGITEHCMETSGGHDWFELKDEAALALEAKSMSHCVGNTHYVSSVLNGLCRIFSMRTKEGRRLLTAEFQPVRVLSSSGLRAIQIKAFDNQSVPATAADCLCEFLDRLGALKQATEAESFAGITFVEGQGWMPIIKAWTRCQVLGLDAIASGRTAHVMSPINTGLPMLVITSDDGWWKMPVAEVRGSMTTMASMADRRHWHADELREVARVVNALGASSPLPGAAIEQRIVENGTGAAPMVDTLPLHVIEGAEYLELGDDTVMVCLSSDLALPLLDIRPRRSSDADDSHYQSSTDKTLKAWPRNVHKWTGKEARRCFAVMSHLGIKAFGPGPGVQTMKDITSKFDPLRGEDGRWYPFTDAKASPSSDGCGTWYVTNERARLISTRGVRTTQIDVTMTKGAVNALPTVWAWTPDHKVLMAFLNKNKVVPIESFAYRPYLPLPKTATKPKGSAAFRNDKSHIVHVRGKWRVVRSQKDIVRLFDGADRPDLAESRMILEMLPIDDDIRRPDAEGLHLECMIRWAETEATKTLDGTYYLFTQTGYETKSNVSFKRRMNWLLERVDAVSPEHSKAIVNLVAQMLDNWTKLPKDALGRTAEALSDVLFKVWKRIPKPLLHKCIMHVFKKQGYWLLTRRPEDIVWVRDIYPTVTNINAKNNLVRGIEWGAGGTSSLKDPARVLVSAHCVKVYATLGNLTLYDMYYAGLCTARNNLQCAQDRPDDAVAITEIDAIISEIPIIVETRRLEAARRWAELDSKFTKSHTYVTESAAA